MGVDVLTEAPPPSGSKRPRTRWVLIVVLAVCIAAGVSLLIWRTYFPPLAGYSVASKHPVRVTVATGCPHNISEYDGVTNPRSPNLRSSLVSGSPTSGLVCRYSPLGGRQHGDTLHGILYRNVVLRRGDAERLATEVHELRRNAALKGPIFCPNDIVRHDVIVFHFSHGSDIDIWFSSTGCNSLNNGVTSLLLPIGLNTFVTDLDSIAPAVSELRLSGATPST